MRAPRIVGETHVGEMQPNRRHTCKGVNGRKFEVFLSHPGNSQVDSVLSDGVDSKEMASGEGPSSDTEQSPLAAGGGANSCLAAATVTTDVSGSMCTDDAAAMQELLSTVADLRARVTALEIALDLAQPPKNRTRKLNKKKRGQRNPQSVHVAAEDPHLPAPRVAAVPSPL